MTKMDSLKERADDRKLILTHTPGEGWSVEFESIPDSDVSVVWCEGAPTLFEAIDWTLKRAER